MKLTQLKTKILSDTTSATLDTSIQTFILTKPTATFISLAYFATYQSGSSNVLFSVLIAYTE